MISSHDNVELKLLKFVVGAYSICQAQKAVVWGGTMLSKRTVQAYLSDSSKVYEMDEPQWCIWLKYSPCFAGDVVIMNDE